MQQQYPDYDLSVSMAPTDKPRGEDIPTRGFTGVEIGVMTIAAAIAVVTLCFMISLVQQTAGRY